MVKNQQVATTLAQIQIPGPVATTPVLEPPVVEPILQQPILAQPMVSQQVFIQSNGDEQNMEAVPAPEAGGVPVPAPSGEMVQVVDAEGNQHVMTIEEATSQGLIQYDGQGEYYTYGDAGQQQFQVSNLHITITINL